MFNAYDAGLIKMDTSTDPPTRLGAVSMTGDDGFYCAGMVDGGYR